MSDFDQLAAMKQHVNQSVALIRYLPSWTTRTALTLWSESLSKPRTIKPMVHGVALSLGVVLRLLLSHRDSLTAIVSRLEV